MKLRLFPFLLAAVLSALLSLCGCGQAQTPGTKQGKTQVEPQSRRLERRNLVADEHTGGHTLARHVAKSDDELRARLARERHISAASTYTDRDAAEISVGEALAQNRGRVEAWAHRAGGHPNLVLDYDAPRPVGRTLHRGDLQSEPCSHAIAVLKWLPPDMFYVLTSYPECR